MKEQNRGNFHQITLFDANCEKLKWNQFTKITRKQRNPNNKQCENYEDLLSHILDKYLVKATFLFRSYYVKRRFHESSVIENREILSR